MTALCAPRLLEPAGITVAELAIELFFPADPHTADVLRALHAAR